MWFKNLVIYRLSADFRADPAALADQLATRSLQPCGALDKEVVGWVPPKGTGPLAHCVNQQWLIAMGVEKKLLPMSVINRFVRDRAAELEEQQGFRPGRKQLRDLKERVTEELLPRAFPALRTTWAWLDPVHRWLVVDAGAIVKADEVLELLGKTLEGFAVKPLRTVLSPGMAMTTWLSSDEAPAGFSIDRDLELRAADDEKATVRYAHHLLEPREIGAHIAAGKSATKLALTWNDRISFVLTEQLQVKRLAPLDIVREAVEAQADGADELFDADFALMSGELALLLQDLAVALGGEAAAPA